MSYEKNANVIPIATDTPAILATTALTGKETVMKKSYMDINLRPLAAAKQTVYEAQEAIVHDLLGTNSPTLRQVDNLLRKLEAILDSLRMGEEEDLGWAWGESYGGDIARLETVIEAVKAVHGPWFAANCGMFEDDVWVSCATCQTNVLTAADNANTCAKCGSSPAFGDDEIPF